MIIPCRLSPIVYSILSQLPSITGGRGDRAPHNMACIPVIHYTD
jgi:hypothetical protein